VLNRFARSAVPWLLCAVLLAGGVGISIGAGAGTAHGAVAEPTPTPAPSSSVLAGSVKYYIVGHTGTGEREYLFQIAAWTLGDGRRYMEIFELNKDRPQPDGLRLEDPLLLMPGWVLILPPDADGPGVLFGPPPVFGSAEASPPAPRSAAPSSWPGEGTLRAIALVVVTAILAGALHLLRRGRAIEVGVPMRAALRHGARLWTTVRAGARRLRPADADGEAATPPPTPTRARSTNGVTSTDGATSMDEAPTTSQTGTANGEAPARPAPPAHTDHQPAPAPVPSPTSTAVANPTTATQAAHPTTAPPTTASPTTGAPAADPTSDPAAADPTATRIETSLRSGQDVLTIRLIGARPDAGGGVVTRGAAAPPRPGGAVVRLGEPGPNALWVDLAASPDVFRITGAGAGLHRQVEEIARQLSRTGVPTVAVGDVPGVAAVADRTVASLRELGDHPDPGHPLVVFLREQPTTDPDLLHDLVRRRPRVVPVSIGSGPRSRWWMDVA